jgi:hypothetical protein
VEITAAVDVVSFEYRIDLFEDDTLTNMLDRFYMRVENLRGVGDVQPETVLAQVDDGIQNLAEFLSNNSQPSYPNVVAVVSRQPRINDYLGPSVMI